MKAWSLSSYRRPLLRVERVEVAGGEVVLHRAGEAFTLSADAGLEPARLARLLEAMRDADSPVWPRLRTDEAWQGLVAGLDSYSLLAEADDGVAAAAASERMALSDLARQAAEWLAAAAAAMDEVALEALRASAGATAELADHLLLDVVAEREPDLLPADFDAGQLRPSRRPRPTADLHGHVLDRLLAGWRHSAPHSVALCCLALRAGAVPPSRAPLALEEVATALLARLAGGPYEQKDAAAHLTCLTALLAASAGPGSRRVLEGVATERTAPCSGTNLVLDAEGLAVRALRLLGPSRFHETLRRGSVPARLAAGTYVEQYHLTRRFVEVILPLMGTRLRTPLRQMMFDYFSEEVGHEVFELETCVALGLDRDAVRASTPLPAWTAYLEVFAEVARRDPIGFLVSVMVTEGLPGTRNVVNHLLAAAGALDGTAAGDVMRQHEEVNVELDHTTLARRFLSEVPAVNPGVQRRALDHLLLVLELNFRAWEDLHGYYTLPDAPALHGAFGTPPEAAVC